jgi:DNA-binding MarR family transcriptional regulator
MSIDADQAVAFLERFGAVKRTFSLVGWRALASLDLGPAQLRLMRRLAQAGPQAQSELARATGADPSATTRALRSLESAGWVQRARGEIDRRESKVTLTAAGRRALRPIEREWRKMALLLTRDFDARDLAAFERLAEKILRLDASPAASPQPVKPQRRR